MTCERCGLEDCPGDDRAHEGLSMTPDVEDVQQETPEAVELPVAVAVDGPVNTRQLPTAWGGAGRRTLAAFGTGVNAVRLIGDDPRRAWLLIAVIGDASDEVCVASTSAGAELGQGLVLTPAHGLVRLHTQGAVFVATTEAAASDAVVTWLSEQWSR